MVFNNTARSNAGFGISLSSTAAFRGNVPTDNGVGAVLGAVNRGSNDCDGTNVNSAYCP